MGRTSLKVVALFSFFLLLAGHAAVAQTNPPPVITSLSPAGAVPGGGSFLLDVFGTGFQVNSAFLADGSRIRWDGVEQQQTNVASTTHLQTTIPASFIAAA